MNTMHTNKNRDMAKRQAHIFPATLLGAALALVLCVLPCAVAWADGPEREWVQLAGGPMWPARAPSGSTVFDGKIWVLGGADDIWYSEDGEAWAQAVELAPWAEDWFGYGAVHDGSLWFITRSGVWSSPNGFDWTQTATGAVPWADYDGFRVAAHAGKLWVFGWGVGKRERRAFYSSDGIQWRQASGSPGGSELGIGNFSCAVHDGKIWLIGGTNFDLMYDANSEAVYYSEDGFDWTLATNDSYLPELAHHTSISYDGKLWVIGGAEYDPATGTYRASIWYSESGVAWTPVPQQTLPYPGNGVGLVVHNGKMWSFGSNQHNTVWSTEDGENWEEVTPWGYRWSARSGHAALAFDSGFWVLGGTNPSSAASPPYHWFAVRRQTVSALFSGALFKIAV